MSKANATKSDNELTKEALLDAFKMADKDSNGYVDRKELERIIQEVGGGKLTPAESRMVFALFDENCDNKINFEEFCNGFKEIFKA